MMDAVLGMAGLSPQNCLPRNDGRGAGHGWIITAEPTPRQSQQQ
jgi:hypothetical protein